MFQHVSNTFSFVWNDKKSFVDAQGEKWENILSILRFQQLESQPFLNGYGRADSLRVEAWIAVADVVLWAAAQYRCHDRGSGQRVSFLEGPVCFVIFVSFCVIWAIKNNYTIHINTQYVSCNLYGLILWYSVDVFHSLSLKDRRSLAGAVAVHPVKRLGIELIAKTNSMSNSDLCKPCQVAKPRKSTIWVPWYDCVWVRSLSSPAVDF